MFKSKPRSATFTADFSGSLRTPTAFKASKLAVDELGLSGDITALAVDPVGGFWAVGLSTGSIHLIGARPIQIHLSVHLHPPTPRSSSSSGAIKHLAFHPSRARLVAIDARSQAHVWSLKTMDPVTGLPWKEATNSLYGTITNMDVPSASTSHLPVTMKDGTTAFLDLERNAFLAPYRIPNLWAQQEDRLRRSGMDVPSRGRPPMAVAVQVSPRDLDQVLVAYEGGVILWSISKQAAVYTYCYMLPPGAPGGGSYLDDDLFTERNPGVTCIAWHPSALSFAVGYEDGCIAFWAVEDPDKPLSVRTVEKADVNVTDAEALFDSGALDRDPDAPSSGGSSPRREPIFKLAWACFPDSAAVTALETAGEIVSQETKAFAMREETCLLVLGGLLPSQPSGLNVLQFPAYRPPSISVAPPAGSSGISSAVRSAFRDSFTATGTFLYASLPGSQVEDFLLVPRASPFLGGGSDPIGLLVLESASRALPPLTEPHSSRELRALTFPPVRSTTGADGERKEYATGGDDFVPITAAPQMTSAPPTPATPSTWSFSSPLSPNPSSLAVPDAPPSLPPLVGSEGFGEYRLPAQFWAGSHGILGCHLVDVPRESFGRLRKWDAGNADGWDGMPRLPLEGGRATANLTGPHAPNMRSLRLEQNRMLVSWHRDGTARFFDLSPHLLVLPDPLTFEYPSPLPSLSILLQPLLAHPALLNLPIGRLLRSDPSRFQIQDVQFAADAAECAVVLASGEVVFFRWSEAREDLEGQMSDLALGGIRGGDVVDLRALSDWTTDGFKPVCMVDVRRGPVAACAVCDAGFLAVSYLQNSVCVADLRGPEIILREGFGEDGSSGERRGSVTAVARCLKFAISGLGNDASPQIRLLASYDTGVTRISTLNDGLAGWTVEKKPVAVTHDSLVHPLASFVLDALKGKEKRVSLQQINSNRSLSSTTPSADVHCVWLAVSARCIRTQANITGDRLATVDLAEDVRSASLLEREGQTVLVIVYASGRGEVYSLPGLELVFQQTMTPPGGVHSFSPSSSDYIHYLSPASITLHTLFANNPAHPQLPTYVFDGRAPRKTLGAQPLPVQSSILASWLGSWGGGVLTGAQIDALVAGPKRPAPNARPVTKGLFGTSDSSDPANRVQSDVAKAAIARSAARSGRGSVPASSSAREEIEGRRSVYQQMADAAAERGNMLDGLSDTLSNVGQQAGEWQKQAKRLALQESAKATAKGFFSKLM